MTKPSPVGEHLRDWRQRRRMTQLDLALEAEISPKHLSFVETGRAQPSRQMVLHLAEHLDVPLRERNAMLVAAGFAPVYPERALDAPDLAAVRRAVDLVLKGHEPFPALVVDRHWNLVAANAAAAAFMVADPELTTPPVNVLRMSLHPKGLASRIINLTEWRAHILDRLRRQIDATADPALEALSEGARKVVGAQPHRCSCIPASESQPDGPLLIPAHCRSGFAALVRLCV